MKSDTSTKKKTVATYSKNHPIQLSKKEHFLTPDTPEIDWLPSSKEMSSKEDMSKKGTILFVSDIYNHLCRLAQFSFKLGPIIFLIS